MTELIPVSICCDTVTPLVTDSNYSWKRLFYSMLIGVISNAGLWISIALMPSLQIEFALTRAEAANPYIATMVGYLVGSPFLGRLTDRFGISRILIIAAVITSFSYYVGGLAQNIYFFLIAQFLVGIGSSVGMAPLAADISHWFRRRRGLALSIVSCAAYLSGLFWTTVIAQVLRDGTWRDVHMIVSVGLLSVIPLSFLLRRRVPHYVLDAADAESTRRADNARVSSTAIKWMLALAGVSCCIAMAIPQIHIVSLCSDLGFSLAQGNEMLSIMLLAGVASRLVSGMVIDRIGPITILLIGSVMQIAALFFYIRLDGLASLYLVTTIFGLAQGGILPSYPLIVREYLPSRSAGEVIGFVSTATMFGMAFGGWLSGWLYDQTGTYFVAFVNGIGWNLVNIALIGLLLLRIRIAPRKNERTFNVVAPGKHDFH